jgi:hypothetical protein
MAYDPVFTLLPLPGDVMERTLGSFKIPASSISFANTFGVMVSVAAYDLAVVPFMNRIGRPISTTARIGYGFIVAIVALLSGERLTAGPLVNPTTFCDRLGLPSLGRRSVRSVLSQASPQHHGPEHLLIPHLTPTTPHPTSAGAIEMARYRIIRDSGLLTKWEAAVAINPQADYMDPGFTQPMRWGGGRAGGRARLAFCSQLAGRAVLAGASAAAAFRPDASELAHCVASRTALPLPPPSPPQRPPSPAQHLVAGHPLLPAGRLRDAHQRR